MLKAVIDTSVFISGLIKSTSPRPIVQALAKSHFILISSLPILAELETVIQKAKFHRIIDTADTRYLLELIRSQALFVNPSVRINAILEDPSDNKFLEAAFAARANCIVSLDAHLLKLKTFENIPIIKPKDFLIKLRHKS